LNLVASDEIIIPALRKWKHYSGYKESGVEWIARKPSHWEMKRLKFVVLQPLQYGANEEAGETDVASPRFVRITDINERGELRDDTFRSLAEEKAKPYLLADGDVLLARSGATVGKSFQYRNSWGKCCFAGYLIRARLDQKKYLPDFLNYFTSSTNYWDWIAGSLIQATIQNVSAEKYGNLLLPLPPPSEQQAIISFLDRETAKIKALVAKKERLIALLQEKRAALITRAVTKGLPSTDSGQATPTVPMKDSAVEWLGGIPAHWEVKQIRNIAKSLQTGPFGSQLHSEDYTPGGIPVINPSHLRDGCIVPDMDCAVDEGTALRLRHHELCEGDIVFARRGEMGRCALVTTVEAGWLCGTGSLRIRPNLDLVYPPFLNRFLSISGIREWLLLEAVGATMDNLNTAILGRMPLLLPPVHEQCSISAFVDSEAIKIDALIAKVREGIEKLKEYRTALISAAVSGKIDVREEIPKGDDSRG
jgi:type I restriction enzyme S subunit